jgi:hypothetical protein
LGKSHGEVATTPQGEAEIIEIAVPGQ